MSTNLSPTAFLIDYWNDQFGPECSLQMMCARLGIVLGELGINNDAFELWEDHQTSLPGVLGVIFYDETIATHFKLACPFKLITVDDLEERERRELEDRHESRRDRIAPSTNSTTLLIDYRSERLITMSPFETMCSRIGIVLAKCEVAETDYEIWDEREPNSRGVIGLSLTRAVDAKRFKLACPFKIATLDDVEAMEREELGAHQKARRDLMG